MTPTIVESLEIDGNSPEGWQPVVLSEWLSYPGQTEDFRGVLSGRQENLAWRYFLLGPVDFEKGIVARVSPDSRPGKGLALFYTR